VREIGAHARESTEKKIGGSPGRLAVKQLVVLDKR
jgi:hypothetical protein